MRRKISCIIVLALALALTMSCATRAKSYATLTTGVKEIQKYGHLTLELTPDELASAGYEPGDMLSVKVAGVTLSVPLCTNYTDVDVGSLLIRDNDGKLALGINMESFANTYLGAVKTTNPDKSFYWTFPEGKSLENVVVEISMEEKGGYQEQYLIHQLEKSNNRADYSSDVVFANFREITGGELGKHALYRSSSPVNNEYNRAKYSDAFVKENGIKCVMNLADSDDAIKGYFAKDDFDSPYYKSLYEEGLVKPLNLGVDFKSDDFKKGLKEGLIFFSTHEGPYLVHCTEGKDRAGFVSALLSAFMGVSYDDIVKDYMVTYKNYYHLEEDSVQYEAVKNSNIIPMLAQITNGNKDTQKGAEEYIRALGLSDSEIAALKANLSKNY